MGTAPAAEPGRRRPSDASTVALPAANGSVPPSPRVVPSPRVKALMEDANTPPETPTARRPRTKHGDEGGRGGIPAALLFGAGVLLLMIIGMAASEHKLRLSKMGSVAVPAPRLSSASFAQQDVNSGGGDSRGTAGANSGFAALFSSAAAAVAEQLSDGFPLHHQSQPKATQKAIQGGVEARSRSSSSSMAGSSEEGRRPANGRQEGSSAADVSKESSSDIVLPSRPAVPAKWWLRCAIVNNLLFHIDVMAGWTYAFQSAGCDVTVYQNERSLGIEDIMSAWFTGRFRKPELFPGEAGDYHIVILPTFRDQHAELIQYLLQLPRLKHQRYFLTQHNPDWLLNHPNVDILQQHLLAPLLSAAHAREAALEAAQAEAGKGTAPISLPPLLRVQVVTLAPCVSNYTLQFLKEMAFNITEGHTYAERMGSFRVRSDTGQGAGDDDSEGLRQWIDGAVDVEVPWLSPLVPWQPALASSEAVVQERMDAATAPEVAAEAAVDATAQRRRLVLADHRPVRQLPSVKHKGGSGDGKVGKVDKVMQPSVLPPAPPPPVLARRGLHPAPPPPPPLGHEAVALLAELNSHRSGEGPRHVCIQGKLENSRRNYTAAFEAISHPVVLRQLRTSGERLLLLGHRSKWESVVIPEDVADVVVVLESLEFSLFFDTLSKCRAILLAFATDEYYAKKSSSTIATAINVGVPLVAERRTLLAYDFLQPDACFVYDDTIPGMAHTTANPGAKPSKQQQGREAEGEQEAAERRLLLAKGGEATSKGGARPAIQQQKRMPLSPWQRKAPQQRHADKPEEPQAGSYSAALLAALRSESSAAARRAVKQLKAAVMGHNAAVAAAFMADTERQFGEAERAADAAWWVTRGPAREAAKPETSWPLQQPRNPLLVKQREWRRQQR